MKNSNSIYYDVRKSDIHEVVRAWVTSDKRTPADNIREIVLVLYNTPLSMADEVRGIISDYGFQFLQVIEQNDTVSFAIDFFFPQFPNIINNVLKSLNGKIR